MKRYKSISSFSVATTVIVFASSLMIVTPGGSYGAAPSKKLPKYVTPETAQTISLGLKYLADTQRSNGSWFNSGGYSSHPVVMTSLAGIALMASGSTPESGQYSKNVRKAMHYLIKTAEANNNGMISLSGGQTMYANGFGMLFLATCYGAELDQETEARLKKVLDKAVALTCKAQSKPRGTKGNPGGGWYYTPGSNHDEGSVTVTQLQALRACRNVGIKVPVEVITRSSAYLKHCQNKDGGICYSADSRGGSRPAISAAGIACFYSAGIFDRRAGGKDGEESRMVGKLLAYVKKTVKVASGGRYSGYYFYTHMYMSQVMYIQAGDDWAKYYPAMSKKLTQMRGVDGSWNGDNQGTVYGTAIACTILQLPYGYLPYCQR